MRRLPCDVENGRFLLRVPLPNGRVARMLVDTGGGCVIRPGVVAGLPLVADGAPGSAQTVRLMVDPPLPPHREHATLSEVTIADGVLPAEWFDGRVWVFDHVAGALWLHEHGDPVPTGPSIRLGYPVRDGVRVGPFPRITATVDDEPVDLLLDTGATAVLTDAGLRAWGEPRVRASSFVVRSRLEAWRSTHRDWPVTQRPTTMAELAITVPSVTLTTGDDVVDLGPVTFESRADENFHTWMSRWMDRRIDGALGGNAFGGRRLVLDVPGAQAWVTT